MAQLFEDVGGTPVRGGDASVVVSPRMYEVEDGNDLRLAAEMPRIEVSRGTSQAGARSDTQPH